MRSGLINTKKRGLDFFGVVGAEKRKNRSVGPPRCPPRHNMSVSRQIQDLGMKAVAEVTSITSKVSLTQRGPPSSWPSRNTEDTVRRAEAQCQ